MATAMMDNKELKKPELVTADSSSNLLSQPPPPSHTRMSRYVPGLSNVDFGPHLQPSTALSTTGTNNSTIPVSPLTHEPYTPSIYSPETPSEFQSLDFGWGPDAAAAPQPLKIRKSNETVSGSRPPFDPEAVPKPSHYELEKPYGGTKHFMMAHGLKWYDDEDYEIRWRILDQLSELEWQNRVNEAREAYARGENQRLDNHSDPAVEYRNEVESVPISA